MARFYCSGSNSRGGMFTAQGASDGQSCHIRGWDCGVKVYAAPDGDRDTFDVYLTKGSHDPSTVAHLVRIVYSRDGLKVEHLDNVIGED